MWLTCPYIINKQWLGYVLYLNKQLHTSLDHINKQWILLTIRTVAWFVYYKHIVTHLLQTLAFHAINKYINKQ